MADKKIEITETCFVNGVLANVGDVLDVEENDASHMVGNGRALYVQKDQKGGRTKAEESKA